MISASKLTEIPGVGASITNDLNSLGISKVADLKGKDPEKMFAALCKMQGKLDRCVLYAFRCAVYFASTTKHDPEKLKWWNWKDTNNLKK